MTMRTELPETAGAMRLAGLEVADCLQEMTGLRCVCCWRPLWHAQRGAIRTRMN